MRWGRGCGIRLTVSPDSVPGIPIYFITETGRHSGAKEGGTMRHEINDGRPFIKEKREKRREKREKIRCAGGIGVASSCSPQRPTGRYNSDCSGSAVDRAL